MAPIDRARIVEVLREVAQLLELSGENPFKVRAYENAARVLEGLAEEPADLVAQGTLGEVKGIGKNLAEHVTELVRSGGLGLHRELRKAFPPGILELFRVGGLGAKKIRILADQLGVRSLADLERACRDGKVAALPGFGAKSQENILLALAGVRKYSERRLRSAAEPVAEAIRERLRGHPGVVQVEIAGSYRRACETVGDLDCVCAVRSGARQAVGRHFADLPGAERLLAEGDTKVSLLLHGGLQIDLRMVDDHEFAAALHHFTGSKDHNIGIRSRARERGITVNEYGLFRGEERLPVASEEELYAQLDLAFVPPELREGRDEIERAERGPLPRLVELGDLTGTLHVHTTWSDGKASLEEMAEGARRLGWSYLGIADHSRSAAYAHGLTGERVREQWESIDRLNRKWKDFRLFKGIECDILADGSLDFDDDLLAGFDFVVASVHSRFSQPRAQITARIARALANPWVTFLGHPTGRLLLEREGYDVDLEEILRRAAAHGVIVELNANPHRLDLDWRYLPVWIKTGLPTSIHPDAHSVAGLADVRFGVGTARKGGLGDEHVLNCRPARALAQHFAARRRRAAARSRR